MRSVRSSSKSGLFLIELIIAIVFFAVSSAICIRLFVQAHMLSRRSAEVGEASTIAQSYAENYKAMSYSEKRALYFSEGGEAADQIFYYGYDDQGQLVLQDRDQGAFYLVFVDHDNSFDPVLSAWIHVYKYEGRLPNETDVSLFSLDVKSYGRAV